MSWLDEVADHLIAQGAVASDRVFTGWLPPEPDDVTALRAYGGFPPRMQMGSTPPVGDRPRLQVVCRALDYNAAIATQEAIYDVLVALVDVELPHVTQAGEQSRSRYLSFAPIQTPFGAGVDDNEREMTLCNYDVDRVRL